ncbi:MAG: TIR domain-containing protein [Usitatibacter sp.]
MPEPKAVFLSYASQDAEPARRICEALRAAGIEAWFDQSELRGGDAWDQSIRRQIKECAMFMPLISANTNARAEGYFRLEWRLGADRSLLMADDAPFFFPVVIDDTPESQARVPDRFREVQWSRMEKESPEAIAARVKKLLAGEARPAAQPQAGRRARKGKRYVWPFIGIGLAVFFALQPVLRGKREPKAPPAAAATQGAEAMHFAQRAIALTRKLNFKPEDLAIAADLARKAAEADPILATAWGARARVEAAWILRNWDASNARRSVTEGYAKRALALDAEEPNALYAQGYVLFSQRAIVEAEGAFRRAMKAAPADNYPRRALSQALFLQGRVDEAITLLEEAVRIDPRDPLNYVTLGASHATMAGLKDRNPASVDTSLAYLDRSIAITPTGNALGWKVAMQAAWKGDLDGARATIAQIEALPREEATEDRMIFFRMWVALLRREPDRALAAANATTATYFTDSLVAQPVAWMKALAHREAKRESAATEEWRAAEAVLQKRLESNPNALDTQAELAITFAMLGRKEEAMKQFARFEAAQCEQAVPPTVTHLRFYAAIGDARRFANAAAEMRRRTILWATDTLLERDPWYDGVRGKAEFRALMKKG